MDSVTDEECLVIPPQDLLSNFESVNVAGAHTSTLIVSKFDDLNSTDGTLQ